MQTHKTSNLKYALSSAFLIFVQTIFAQTKVQSYIDVGKNNVSETVFVQAVLRGSYTYQLWSVEAGMQADIISENPNTLTGFDIIGSREFSIKSFPVTVKGFYLLNRYSDLMYETDWGAGIETKGLQHFIFKLGTNFRTYAVNSDAAETYDINPADRKIHENFNLIYNVTACLKPHDHQWNVGLSITNIDYYIINQSTNPLFNLRGNYKLTSKLNIYLEAWYKQAGIFNIYANYFGYNFRGGVIWEF